VGRLFGFFFFMICIPALVIAQKPDSVFIQKDSLQVPVITITNHYESALQTILKQNTFLNSQGIPITMAVKTKKTKPADTIFYLLATLVFLMGLIKFFFARYFTNLFKVFFNTSFRQSQLADQLLQAKLPSLFFNAFFIISGGVYIYFLLLQYKFITDIQQWKTLASCILVLGLVYLAKFSTLKFTGWVTGYREVTDAYIFVIFLICKIIGVLLVPFIILMAFTDAVIANDSALASLLIVVLLLLLRFLRSYGLLQNQLKVSRFHFFLYIAGVEILPLLLIYKGLLFLLSKNL
jgi:Domain of unknown function (DUF4271)